MDSGSTAGRGRGRGGVPVLPSGLWESLQSGSGGADVDEKIQKSVESLNRYDDADESITPEFGKRKAHENSYPDKGMGLDKVPKKGGIPDPSVDWTCLSCGNVNWARR